MTLEKLIEEAWYDGWDSDHDEYDKFIELNQPAIDQAKREAIEDFANWHNKRYATTLRINPMVRITETDVNGYMESIS